MKLYTVDRGSTLREGMVLNLTKEDPYKLPFLEVKGLLNSDELAQHLFMLFPDGLSHHGWVYLKYMHTVGCSSNYQLKTSYLMEMNLEYVRKAHFPDKPSRLQSLFASESLDDATKFLTKYRPIDSRIFEIEADEYLKVDMSFILLGTQNVMGSFLAHQYWNEGATNNPCWEYLVKLPATVLKQVG